MRPLQRRRLLLGVLLAGLTFAMPVAHASAVQIETCKTATTLALNLGLMRGHLMVAAELFEAGHYELAQRHSKHPAEEVYQELLPALARFELPEFASELSAFAEVLAEGEEGRKPFRDRYALLMQTMNILEAQLPLQTQQQNSVAFELVKQAAYEYSVGVAADGRVTDIQEYQDAYGFVTVAKAKVAGGVTAETGKDGAELAERFSLAMSLWPTLMPAAPLQVEPERFGILIDTMTAAGMAETACD